MRVYLIVIALTFITATGYAQVMMLSDIKDGDRNPVRKEFLKTTSGNYLIPTLLLWPLNPALVVEEKKVNFALTKEVSVFFPKIRSKIGFEYSYVFRSERNSHLRLFADCLIPLEAGDVAVVLLNAGGGYFTDTKKSGLFPQISLSIVAPTADYFAVNLYVKARQTFMFKKEDSNIFDASIGFGVVFLL